MSVFRYSTFVGNSLPLKIGDVVIVDMLPTWCGKYFSVCGNVYIYDIQGNNVGQYNKLDKLTMAPVKYINQPFIYGGEC